MDKYKVLVIGLGTVGSRVARSLMHDYTIKDNGISVHVYDKYKEDFKEKELIHFDFAFVCVDTPYSEDLLCDIGEVISAIRENDADTYIIKSTVLPEQANYILHQYSDKNIVFSPEYYGATQHCNNFDFNYTILGGAKEDCTKVIQLLQNVYDGTHQFRITTPETACLVKYMENSYLATQVSFCNQFYDIAEKVGVDYEELRELFILDPRVNPSHTFVYRDRPYWDSHCLNKDVPAIAEEYDATLLKDIITFNNSRKHNEE